LDADQLEDLELIFETVRSSTRNLVVLLTQEVLSRMWCAGEIVTAQLFNIPMVPVLCDGYSRPDGAGIRGLCDLWTEGEKHTLATFGIVMDMVQTSYQVLIDLPTTNMPRFGGQKDQEEAVFALGAGASSTFALSR